MNSGGEDNARLRKELTFRNALVQLTNDLLVSKLDASFYQTALERTIKLVPAADGGSVMARHEDGRYHFEAAYHYDFGALQQVSLSEDDLGPRREHTEVTVISVADYNQRLQADQVTSFQEAGNLDRIKATLSVPLRVGDQTLGYFNLDNFADRNAFDSEDMEIAAAIGAQVSVALYRLVLEHRLEEERKRYRHMAHHDPLTELGNRRLFMDSLGRALSVATRQNSRVGVLYVDMDRFKAVNDTYGHDAGDIVLTETAKRLRNGVRGGDVPARLGGDEFGIILMDIQGTDAARAIHDKICAALSQPIRFREHSITISASVGIAIYPDDSTDLEGLLRAVDTSMYIEKTGDSPQHSS
ncbi:MAG TPA: sensor domain-containing diguanylate cyclase [Alkalispirochaeta sp.]|nr:sensor domain-containing diguanylate cyclase [Alkalispirochaeta sp.]